MVDERLYEFPSPYGVIFILTFKTCNSECIYRIRFRLLTEYHSFLFITHEWLITFDVIPAFPSPYGVSFILIISFILF